MSTISYSLLHHPRLSSDLLASRVIGVMAPPQAGLEKIATRLSCSSPFPSKIVVPLDAIVVNGLFQQRTKKKTHRTHTIQNIALSFHRDPETLEHIRRIFQNNKERLCFDNPDLYQKLVRNMATEIYRCHPSIKSLGYPVQNVLEWYVRHNI